MTSKVGWYFPIDESDQWDGFNEPGIEHFRGSPVIHLAREINQNSLDATATFPVTVEFKCHKISPSQVPHIQDFTRTLESCRASASEESEKARTFFAHALTALSKPKIPVLVITDWNTYGLRGPCVNGTPYYAFMKAEGQSKKETDTAGGSYGIGKYAPYAVSNFRTIFVSTVYQDNNKQKKRLTQGKSVLMSYDDARGRHRGVGFWGVTEKCMPIEGGIKQVPEWLVPAKAKGSNKDDTGTTLSILGFSQPQSWQALLRAAVAENFFGAIADGKLIVRIGDNYTVDSSNVQTVFEDTTCRDVLQGEKGEPEQFDNAGMYLCAHSGTVETITEETESNDLGFCRLKILLREGASKRVAILRNGMFITDQLDGLKRFGEFKDFVAVVECRSDKGNALLRDMEPPRHDDFEPMRLLTNKKQRQGKRALRELSGWVREMLRRHAKDSVSEVTSIDELSQYFGDDAPEGSGTGGQDVNPEGKIIVRAKPVPRRPVLSRPEQSGGDEGSGDDEGNEGGEKEGNGHSSDGDSRQGATSGGTRKSTPVALSNVRGVREQDGCWTIAFTPSESVTANVAIDEAGADTEYPVSVVSTSEGELTNGMVTLSVERGERKKMKIALAEDFEGAIRVSAYEV